MYGQLMASRRLGCALILLTLLGAACGSPGHPDSSAPQAPSLATFKAELAQAGIPVVADFDHPAPRWQLTEFQVSVMHEQLTDRQGFAGSELDTEAPITAGGATVSYLIAAWIVGAKTPRSNLVSGWMGRQDWRHAPNVVFPTAVLALFSIDMAEHMAADAGRAQSASASSQTVLMDIVSAPCSTVDTFFSNAIAQLFNLLHLSPSFLGHSGPLGIVGAFIAGIWNTLTGLVQGMLTGIVTKLAAPIVAAISVAVAAVSLISQVGAVMGAWNLKAVVSPPGGGPSGLDRFAVGSEPDHRNTVVLSASSLLDSVPAALKDCAATLGSPLPTTLDPGTSITWTVLTNENVVGFPAGLQVVVAADGTATLAWTTGREATASGQVVSGVAELHTLVQNPGATALAKFAQRLIGGAINSLLGSTLAPVVVNFLHGISDPVIAGMQSRLGDSAFNQTADVVMLVTHHQCDPSGCPSPTSSPPTSPSPSSCLVGRWISGDVSGTGVIGGGSGVVLTITNGVGGTFKYTADYSGMKPVTEDDGQTTYQASGVETGTLTPAGDMLNRQVDDSGLTTTITRSDGTTSVFHGTAGLHSTPPVTFSCTSATLQFTYVGGGGEVVDNYARSS